MDNSACLAQTNKLITLLNQGGEGNLDWQAQFDEAFKNAIFDHDFAQPYFVGPDHFRYYGFKVPGEMGTEISVAKPREVLDELVHWSAGAAILTQSGQEIYVFSPGDIISLKLFGTTQVLWKGGWGQEPDWEFYESGGPASMGRPNDQMVPPLVARCLDTYLSRYFSSQEKLATRIPGITLIRPDKHVNPEDASELMLNVFPEDFNADEEFTPGHFLTWIDRLLPRHLRIRLIMQSQNYVNPEDFTPLKTMFMEAGLEPGPT